MHDSSGRIYAVIMSHANFSEARSLADLGVRDPIEAWAHGVRQTLRALRAARIPVLLVGDVPLISNQPAACRFGVVFPLDCSVARGFVAKIQAPAEDATDATARTVPQVRVLTLTHAFCTRSECSALQHREVMYIDNQHLSAAGSLYVAADLRAGIASILR
jgi:hypothetical protein